MPAEDDGLDLGSVRVNLQGEAAPESPLANQVRDRLPDRSEEQNGRTSPHPVIFRKSLCPSNLGRCSPGVNQRKNAAAPTIP